MALRTRSALTSFLSRLGGRAFGFLTGCEERRLLPDISRWMKVSILGLLVTAIGWLSARSVPYPGPMCYAPPVFWNALISDVSISPNPTAGADSVTVRARAASGSPLAKDAYIKSASLNLANDTNLVQMRAADGAFSDSVETIEGRLYVGSLEPESTWVQLTVTTSNQGLETQWFRLVISEPDTTVKDSTTAKPPEEGSSE